VGPLRADWVTILAPPLLFLGFALLVLVLWPDDWPEGEE
jgi:hypothetical protein